MSSDFAACLSEPCWDDLTAAYPLTKLIKLTHHVDVHAHAHLPASRGYPSRVTIVGGSVLIFFSPLNPPSLNLIEMIVHYPVWGFIDQALWLMILTGNELKLV